MVLKYDKEKLQETLIDFYNATGIPLSLYDAKFNKIISVPYSSPYCELVRSKPEGLERCYRSDRELLVKCFEKGSLVTYRCHAGITYAAAPIYDKDTLFGFIMIRQSNTESSRIPFSEVYKNISDLEVDEKKLEEAYHNICLFDRTQTESSFKIATMLTKYICFENIIKAEYGNELENVIEYIDTHFAEDLTVPKICHMFNISKNSLYNGFRRHFNVTVKEYINARRISRAEYLLKTTRYTVYEICGMCGIDNYQYFCRLFKKLKGITPLQYRKKWSSEKDYTL